MNKIKIISKSSSLYPNTFYKIKPVPELIFAIGNINLLKNFSVAVVGARACSEESKLLTKDLVHELVNRNIVIISGMADGIDQVAHRACIENGGKTIAIIGAGFDIVKEERIYNDILKNNGLILSEYFPDTPAFRYNFPRRNKLMVALSSAVITVETHLKSGTMITAKEAIKQKVPLFTFPGSLYNSRYSGNNILLTKGAKCINNYLDVIKSLRKIYPNKSFYSSHNPNTEIIIPQDFEQIYSILSQEPKDINSLARETGIQIKQLQSKLTIMEMNDWVCRIGVDGYIKNKRAI